MHNTYLEKKKQNVFGGGGKGPVGKELSQNVSFCFWIDNLEPMGSQMQLHKYGVTAREGWTHETFGLVWYVPQQATRDPVLNKGEVEY